MEMMTPKKQCSAGIRGLMHIWPHRDCGSVHKACTGSSQTRVLVLSGELDKYSSPPSRSYLQLTPAQKREINSSDGFLLGIQTTLKVRPHAQQQMVNTNKSSGIFCRHFHLKLRCLNFFSLFVLFVFCLCILVSTFVFLWFKCASYFFAYLHFLF